MVIQVMQIPILVLCTIYESIIYTSYLLQVTGSLSQSQLTLGCTWAEAALLNILILEVPHTILSLIIFYNHVCFVSHSHIDNVDGHEIHEIQLFFTATVYIFIKRQSRMCCVSAKCRTLLQPKLSKISFLNPTYYLQAKRADAGPVQQDLAFI